MARPAISWRTLGDRSACARPRPRQARSSGNGGARRGWRSFPASLVCSCGPRGRRRSGGARRGRDAYVRPPIRQRLSLTGVPECFVPRPFQAAAASSAPFFAPARQNAPRCAAKSIIQGSQASSEGRRRVDAPLSRKALNSNPVSPCDAARRRHGARRSGAGRGPREWQWRRDAGNSSNLRSAARSPPRRRRSTRLRRQANRSPTRPRSRPIRSSRWRANSPRAPISRLAAALPEVFAGLNFEQYAAIRRKPGSALWADEKLGFALEPLHRGFVYTTPLELHIVENGQAQRIVYDPAAFDFGKTQAPQNLRRHRFFRPSRAQIVQFRIS